MNLRALSVVQNPKKIAANRGLKVGDVRGLDGKPVVVGDKPLDLSNIDAKSFIESLFCGELNASLQRGYLDPVFVDVPKYVCERFLAEFGRQPADAPPPTEEMETYTADLRTHGPGITVFGAKKYVPSTTEEVAAEPVVAAVEELEAAPLKVEAQDTLVSDEVVADTEVADWKDNKSYTQQRVELLSSTDKEFLAKVAASADETLQYKKLARNRLFELQEKK
jgi:hypothetical protein